MAYLPDTYSGTGSQTDFVINFDYVSRDFVVVVVDEVTQTVTTDYTFIADDQIRFVTAPPATAADNVVISRVTSTALVVDFEAGAGILDTDLDNGFAQVLHLAEERASEAFVAAAIAEAEIDADVTVSSFSAGLLSRTSGTSWVTGLGASSIGGLNFFAANGITALQNMGVTSYESFGIIGNSTAAAHRSYHGIDVLIPNPNLIPFNADFQIWQEGATFANAADASLTADNVVVLSDGGTPDVDQFVSSLPDNAVSGLELTPGTIDTKAGIFMPIESKLSVPLRSKTVTISVDAQNQGSSDLTGYRMHLVSWAGTADAVPAEIISAWDTALVVPTPVGSLTLVEPDTTDEEEFTIDGAWTTYSATFTVPANANNLGVFICTNDASFSATAATRFTKVKMEHGELATPFASQPFSQEFAEAQRFYQKSFLYDVVADDNAGFEGALHASLEEWGSAQYGISFQWMFPHEMFANPTVTPYNPDSGTAGRPSDKAALAYSDALTQTSDQRQVTLFENSTVVPTSSGVRHEYWVHFDATARFIV